MPNKKAAFKSIRQDKKKHLRNKSVMTEIRSLAKKARTLISTKNRKEADAALKTLESKLDKAAKVNVIKKNTASRSIARLRSQWSRIESKA